jgi:hypothetical protein
MSARQDLTLDAGRDYEIAVVLTEADLTTPLNLLDCVLEWAVAEAPGLEPLISKSSVIGGITVTDIGNGGATIHVLQADTELLGGITAQHEMLVTDALGAEATVFAGLVTIIQSVLH